MAEGESIPGVGEDFVNPQTDEGGERPSPKRAFRLKGAGRTASEVLRDAAAQTSSPEGSNTSPEITIGELTGDETTVKNFSFYFDKVTSGKISERELRARFLGKFTPENGDLLDVDGQVFQPGGGRNYLELPVAERGLGLSDPEQRDLVIQLLTEVQTATTEREGAEKSAKALTFYAGKAVEGKISERELRARFLGKFTPENGDLLDVDGQVFQPGGGANYLELPVVERGLGLTASEQRELIVQLLTEVQATTTEKEGAEKSAKALTFYAGKAVEGKISERELRARFEGKFTRENGDLLDVDGQVFQPGGGRNYLELPVAERGLGLADPEQRAAILQLRELLNDPGIANEVKGIVGNYVRSSDGQDLNRLKAILAENSGSVSGKVEAFVESFDVVKRRATLKQEFYTTLLDGTSIDPALAVLEVYDEDDTTDRLLVSTLGQRALGIRRARVTRDFGTALAAPDRDIDQTLAALNVLATSRTPEDRECARILTQAAYQLELATNRDEVRKMITLDADPKAVYEYIDGLQIRPAVGELDYLQAQIALKDTARTIFTGTEKITRLKTANEIRRNFATLDVDTVLGQIGGLPDETAEEIALKTQLLGLYKNYAAANRPGEFDEKFAGEIFANIQAGLQERFISPELGTNREAAQYLAENFRRYLMPLVESFRDDPRTQGEMDKLLKLKRGDDGEVTNPRSAYIQRLADLEQQRPLTDVEREYLRSVQFLSLFNPQLVAVALADQGVTTEFLRHHFDTLSHKTIADLQDGDYVPLIVTGTGPNGATALGEIVRNNPELASQMLVLDSGEEPGGPFAIPGGPAWELNSANARGRLGYTMPEAPGNDELKSVRAYGSPLRWYPGERRQGADVRQGSINTTVDYLPIPDNLSNKRYPTNEEEALILSLQAAMVTRKLAFNTDLITVEPNPNPDEQGDKIATVKITERDGTERTIRLKTDATFTGSGLGEKGYGFRLEGSRAEQVLEQTKDAPGFPKVSTTLEGFRALSNRREDKQSPGRTLVISGKGNSVDTIVENVGGLFQGDNPLARDITKIYVICEGDLSARPRYAAIGDLRPRNGRGNLIEFINARVEDVDFATTDGKPEDRELVFYDANDQLITDDAGTIIQGNSFIAATGFRPKLDEVYASYLGGRSLREDGDDAPVQPLTLPTNPDVAVADILRADPSILLLGTASQARFESLEKLAQLPVEAREALLRNGAENAVAIGFRAPDTQAAVNIWLNSRDIDLEALPAEPLPQIPIEGTNLPDTRVTMESTVATDALLIPNNVEAEDLLLSPLLAYNIASNFELDSDFSGAVDFELTYDADKAEFGVQFKGGDLRGISSEFLTELTKSASDEYFQRYALSLLGKRRRDPKLDLNISFQRGKVNPKNTFVQAA